MSDNYCPTTIAAIREQLVREHKVLPRPNDQTEQQWAREGVKREGTQP